VALTSEQSRHLDPPERLKIKDNRRFYAKYPKGSRPFNLDETYLPDIDYDEHWTEDQEKDLWSQWLVEDEKMLEAMRTSEHTAWAKARRNYGIAAPDILQSPLIVWTVHDPVEVVLNKRMAESVDLEQINWGEGFSRLFVKILCCVAFASDLAFLRYTLQYALHFRLGQKLCPKPSRSILFAEDDDEDWFDIINATAQEEDLDEVPERYRELINLGCRKKAVDKNHPHMPLIPDLRRQVKVGSKPESKGLCNTDITNIIRAWDERYIIRTEHKGALKTMDENHDAYEAKGNTHKRRWSKGQTMSRFEEVQC
jgi:hypothetical protein